MRDALSARTAVVDCSTDKALGFVLAHECHASIDLPSMDYSAMDGYAVRAAEISSDVSYPISHTAHAGAAAVPLPLGSVARIFTGAVMPAGADAVIPQEQAHATEALAQFDEAPQLGQYINRKSMDCARGQQILPAGKRLLPHDMAILAAQGQKQVSVHKPLRVGILSIGRELSAADMPLTEGLRYDVNGPLLKALLDWRSIEVLDGGLIDDDPAQLRSAFETLIERGVDCIISSGGVSVGARDYTRSVIEAMGRLRLWGLALKPGKPFAFGDIGDDHCPIFALPGNPASVLVGFCMILRPCLSHMQGCTDLGPVTHDFKANFNCPANEREQILCARVGRDDSEGWIAQVEPAQSSAIVSIFTRSNALLRVPAGVSVSAGERAQGWWIRDFYEDA